MDLRHAMADATLLRWWSVRLPGPLEQNFNDQTTADRIRQMRFWIGASLVFYWICFGLEFTAVPDRLWLSFWVRVGLMSPLSVLSIVVLGRVRPGWVQSLIAILAPTLDTLAQLGIFMSSRRIDTLLDTVVLGLEVLWMNVLFPFRIREAVLFSLVTMGAGDAINAVSASVHHTPLNYLNVAIAAHGLVILSLLGRAVSEQNLRRSFLQGLSLHRHAEELLRANAKLVEMSQTDPLTGVGNRRYFRHEFDQLWQRAREKGTSLAVIMIDVDHFKLFNDTAGHLEGDRCLATIARIISQQLRSGSDILARFGGEEFVVLMADADTARAKSMADRMLVAIAAQRVFHPANVGNGFVSVSIGVAATLVGRNDMQTPAELIEAADTAMYEAKADGRNRVAVSHAAISRTTEIKARLPIEKRRLQTAEAEHD